MAGSGIAPNQGERPRLAHSCHLTTGPDNQSSRARVALKPRLLDSRGELRVHRWVIFGCQPAEDGLQACLCHLQCLVPHIPGQVGSPRLALA
jgi:hypothetical protein